MSSQIRQARVFFVVILGLCISILLLPSRVSTQATCVQPPSGIIAWWPLDETSGTSAEDIVGGLNGVHINNPAPVPGKVGGALRFDGSSYLGVPDSDLWAFGTNDFTIELWANWDSQGSGDLVHAGDVLIGNDEGPGLQNKWFFALGGGFLHFTVYNELDPPSNFFLVRAPFSPTVGQWYHLGVTKRSTLFTIYVDGIPVGSEISTSPIANPDAPLIIGQSNEPFGGFMNGLLDEVTIYNRALAQGELQAIFDAGSAGKCKTLSISTKALSAVQLGTFSTQTLEARFGSGALNWSLVSGTLPAGMTLNSDGVLSGTPTVAGLFPIMIRVTDSLNATMEKNFSLEVLLIPPPPDIRVHKTGTLAVPGRTIDYFILVENLGSSRVKNAAGVEFLQPSSSFSLLSTEPSPLLVNEAAIFWQIPVLERGQAELLFYRVRLDPSVPLGTTVGGEYCQLSGNDNADCGVNCEKDKEEACFLAGPMVYDCENNPLAPGCITLLERCKKICMPCQGTTGPVENINTDFPFDNCSAHEQPARGPVDPNIKEVVAKRFIQPDQLLVYPIHFENIGDIEARDVFVTDQLDPNLDSSTLNLLTPAGGSFDVATRTVRWDLLNTNLDPGATGNVLLSIRPRPGLPSGTVIRNSATIQFEVFKPIVTNEVVNIIDSTRPAAVVNPLPSETSTLNFPISWSGSDAVGEIDFYSIFVSVDGGAFTPFLERTRDTSTTFTGEVGKTYGFLAIATDTAGNIEVQPATAEASTRIVITCSTGDLEPPTITSTSASPQALWPPDHTMREVSLNYTPDDNCGPVNCTITNITSNEPVNGTGDGDTAPDWEVVDARHVRLRAERAATGSGRTYTITITCVDSAGNSTSRNVNVFVQHDASSLNTGVATVFIFLNKFFLHLL